MTVSENTRYQKSCWVLSLPIVAGSSNSMRFSQAACYPPAPPDWSSVTSTTMAVTPKTSMMHVIASKTSVLESLEGCGFVGGLVPAPQAIGRMHQLGPALLRSFESQEMPTKCPLQPGDAAPGHTADRS